MEKLILSILSAGVVIALCLLATEKTFSQTSKDERKSDTTKVTSKADSSSYTYVKGLTPMRSRSLVGVALALASLVISWGARRRAAAGIGNKGRNGAIVALSCGAIAIVLSIIHLYITAGAVFGSGSGKAGAIFALLLGLTGIMSSGLVLRRKTLKE